MDAVVWSLWLDWAAELPLKRLSMTMRCSMRWMMHRGRSFFLVYLEMLQGCEVGATSPYARSLVDARVLAALDSRICTRETAEELSVRQFYYSCTSCGLVRSRGCCEGCVRSCHIGHEIALVPKLGDFEYRCGTAEVNAIIYQSAQGSSEVGT